MIRIDQRAPISGTGSTLSQGKRAGELLLHAAPGATSRDGRAVPRSAAQARSIRLLAVQAAGEISRAQEAAGTGAAMTCSTGLDNA